MTDSAQDATPAFAVGFLLSTLGYRSHAMWEECLVPLGVDSRQAATLIHVARAEGQSQRDLARVLRIAPSRVVTLVDELERRNLLRRRSDPTDRRVRTLHLTAKGRTLVRRLGVGTNAHEAWLLSGLEGAEGEHLLALLKKVAAGLDVSDTAHTGLAKPDWRRP